MKIKNHRKSVHALYIKLLCTELESHGVSIEESLSAAHLPKNFMGEGDGLISIFEYRKMTEFARRRTGRDWIGLEIGKKIISNHHGVLGSLIASSSNGEAAILALVKYLPLRTQLLRLDFSTSKQVAQLNVKEQTNLGAIRVVFLEAFFGIFVNFIEVIYGKKIKNLCLDFNYPPPIYSGMYEDIFECPVRFNQKLASIRFDVDILNTKNLLADSQAHRIAEIQCEKIMGSLISNGGLKNRIENIILDEKSPFPTLEHVAKNLSMSRSTFIRRLAAAGTSYKKILNDIRWELANYYLVETSLSIENIAEKLGYLDTSNFARVFKRWHDITPSQFRSLQLEI